MAIDINSITNESKELAVRLISEGHDTKQALTDCGLSEGLVRELTSHHSRDQIAAEEGQHLVLTRHGADLLYQMKKEDAMRRQASDGIQWAKYATFATIIMGIISIVVPIVLSIFQR